MKNDLPLFIICSEAHFDWQSRLLIRSLRTFGGRFSSADVVSYSPRPNHPPSANCANELRGNHVEIICDYLNKNYKSYPLSNKILSVYDARQRFPGRDITFLDSDKLIMGEPTELSNLDRGAALLRPVDFQNVGSKDYDSKFGPYWSRIHEIAGARSPGMVETTIDKTQIMSYYNSGMIGISAADDLPRRWLKTFEVTWKEGLSPGGDNYFLEQSTLAAAVSASAEPARILPETYNVPIHAMQDWPRHPWRAALSDNVSVHYHWALNSENRTRTFDALKAYFDADLCKWISKNLTDVNQG